MKVAIKTGLPNSGRPFEWAIASGGFLYLIGSPIAADGKPEQGGPAAQVKTAIANMDQAIKAAGGTLNDITQAMVYVVDRSYIEPLNEEWVRKISPPYPNRAIALVTEIGAKDVGIVIMAHAHIAPANRAKKTGAVASPRRRRR